MGDDARDYVAENLKEGVDPSAIDDWGEHDRDYSEDEHEIADGKVGDNRVQTFYESTIGGLIDIL
ncbi:MAG: hypothetical protein ACFB0C_20855 [Leptolyngbyaceae cyanobacterium]